MGSVREAKEAGNCYLYHLYDVDCGVVVVPKC